MPGLSQVSHPAIVARREVLHDVADLFLQLDAGGVSRWTDDEDAATAFDSLREAMRAAARLPAALRAYGIPRPAEPSVGRELH
jgi:hypothetical protein